MGKELQRAACGKLGGKVPGGTFISQTWGLSETTGSFTVLPRDRRDDTGSVSMVIPGHEIR